MSRAHDTPPSRHERRWAAAAHLSALVVAAAVVAAVGYPALGPLWIAPVGPLVILLLTRADGDFVRGHAREAVRFSLSYAFYAVGVGLGLTFLGNGDGRLYGPVLFLALFLALHWLSSLGLATVRALRGNEVRYPFVLRFWGDTASRAPER